MQFDPNNKVIQLCAKGMEMEANQPGDAEVLFLQAWNEASNDFEKFTAAHYVARHQTTTENKLSWDKTALEYALKIEDDEMACHFPSLYLNIGKCYEDLDDFDNAKKSYETALSYTNKLTKDAYGEMISAGIHNGLKRVADNYWQTNQKQNP